VRRPGSRPDDLDGSLELCLGIVDSPLCFAQLGHRRQHVGISRVLATDVFGRDVGRGHDLRLGAIQVAELDPGEPELPAHATDVDIPLADGLDADGEGELQGLPRRGELALLPADRAEEKQGVGHGGGLRGRHLATVLQQLLHYSREVLRSSDRPVGHGELSHIADGAAPANIARAVAPADLEGGFEVLLGLLVAAEAQVIAARLQELGPEKDLLGGGARGRRGGTGAVAGEEAARQHTHEQQRRHPALERQPLGVSSQQLE